MIESTKSAISLMPEPLYILGAAPTERVRVPTLTTEEGVRQQLENPPHARDAGWNLVTLERAALRPGPRLHIQNGERKYFDLLEDGTFTAIGTFAEFLGHGRWDFSQKPLANGLALVEFTYEFVAFYERLLREYIEPMPAGARFAVALRDAHFDGQLGAQRLMLAPGPVGDWYDFGRVVAEAPEPSFYASLDTPASDDETRIDVGRVSFDLLRRLYNFYGLTNESVPYVTEQGDAIDFDQVRNM